MHDNSPILPEHSIVHVIEGKIPRGNTLERHGLRGGVDRNVKMGDTAGRGGTCEADEPLLVSATSSL